MNSSTKPKVLFIGGPTASGKTDLSLKLAKQLNGEIISADSRQVYIGMDIGTAKIVARKNPPQKTENLYLDPVEFEGINHYMIDILYPNERFSLFDFKEKAYELIKKIIEKKKTPIVVGGTGLYIDALIKNYQLDENIKTEDLKVRKELENEYKYLSTNLGELDAKKAMHEKLSKLNSEAAQSIHYSNIYSVIRELEFCTINKGKTKSSSAKTKEPFFEFELIITDLDRADLYKKIEDRIDLQIKEGLIEETEKLIKKYGLDLPALTSLGYKEIADFIENKISFEEAVLEFKKKTRNYAKRQITWFRRYK